MRLGWSPDQNLEVWGRVSLATRARDVPVCSGGAHRPPLLPPRSPSLSPGPLFHHLVQRSPSLLNLHFAVHGKRAHLPPGCSSGGTRHRCSQHGTPQRAHAWRPCMVPHSAPIQSSGATTKEHCPRKHAQPQLPTLRDKWAIEFSHPTSIDCCMRTRCSLSVC